MFADNGLAFSSTWSTPQALSATGNSTNVVDITGAGVGNAPAMINGFPAKNTAIGEDYGAGDGVAIPFDYVSITTGAAGGATGNLTITLQAAPDNGSYSPGTYTTLFQSEPIPAGNITAGFKFITQVPPVLNDGQSGVEALPRFYRNVYTIAGNMTCSVLSGLVINPPSSLLGNQYANNFAVV